MRTKAQILKTASTLKTFSGKLISAQEGETLTPETAKEIAEEIKDVAEVAFELAEEMADNLPVEDEGRDPLRREEDEGVEQIEVAADETEEEKRKRLEKTAQDEDDDDKKKLKEQVASLSKELSGIKREATLAKLAPKYASLFPKQMHEAKMNEILNSKQPLNIVEAKIQEASDIISNKTMVKVASMTDSIYDFDTSDGNEINISGVL